MVPLTDGDESSQIHRGRRSHGGSQRLGGEGNGQLVCNVHGVSVGKMAKFWTRMVVMVAEQCERDHCHRTAHLKMVEMASFYVYILL